MDQRNNLGITRNGRFVAPSLAPANGDAPASPATLRPSLIRRNGGTQMRAKLDVTTVQEYHDLIRENGGRWPFRDAVRVAYDGSAYWLVDGFHRLQAWQMHYGDPAPAVPVVIESGDLRQAVLLAAGANAEHGLRRTDEDKRIAVDRLLADDEWSAWSDGEIARRCGVSRPFVAKRKEILAKSAAVADWLGQTAPPQERTFTNRHGGTSTMRTAGIAESNKSRSASGGLASGKLGASVVGSDAGGSRATAGAPLAHCTVCRRPLTDQASAVNGMGPCCAAKAARVAATAEDKRQVALEALAAFHAAAVIVLDGAHLYGELAGQPGQIELRRIMIDVVRLCGAKLTAEGGV